MERISCLELSKVPNYAPGHKPNISGSRRPRALTAAAFTLGLVED